MIPLVQPTVSFIKKWGQSLHILPSSSLTPRSPAWNPSKQCCPAPHWKQRSNTSLGMGLLQFLPCPLGIAVVWYQLFFLFYSATHMHSPHKHAHTYTLSQIICSNYYFWSAQKCSRPFTKNTTETLLHTHSSDSDPKILIQASLKMSWKASFDRTNVDQA